MKPAAFELVLPDSLAAAHAALVGGGGRAVLLAGGQSLVPRLAQRLMRPDLVIGLGRVAGLGRLERTGAELVLGPGVTHADLEDLSPRDRLGDILPAVAAGIASRGVRNRATLAGCLANGDPLHDWLTALPALGAAIRLETAMGARVVAAADWLPLPFCPVLAPDEIITAITLRQPSMDAGWGYVKIAQKVNAAPLALAAVLADPSCGLARIAVGSAAGVAVLPEMAERWMAGRADRAPLPELSEIEAAVAAAWPQADPLICAMAAAALQRALAQAAT
jgi:carbon-monoxide dehydrogenase medium subunit